MPFIVGSSAGKTGLNSHDNSERLEKIDSLLGRMSGEQPGDKPGQRFAIPRRQALEHRQDVGFEVSRGLRHECPAVVGKADQHGPPVRDRRNAHDQAAPLSAIDQARDAGLVESQDPRQFVHGRGAVAQHS